MYRYVLLCVFSQFLFASLYLFSYGMQPLSGTNIFALRMVAMWVGLFLLVDVLLPRGAFIRFLWVDLARNWQKLGLMLLGTVILASQLWLFMWAPINGEGVNVAMGYFLFPLMMVLGGRIFWQEKLNFWQGLSLVLACLGVAHEFYHYAKFSWTTLWVALLYPPYYLSRRALKIPALLGLFFDICWIAPCCLIYLWFQSFDLLIVVDEVRFWWLLPLLGLVSTLAMFLNFYANFHLPVKIFGMLSYLEPALLFLCAVLWLKTPVEMSSYVSYAFIWAGLVLLGVQGFAEKFRRLV